MEKKIQRKFILASSSAMLLMLLMVIGLVIAVLGHNIRSRIYERVDYIADNNGVIPDYREVKDDYDKITITPESQYEYRYFSLVVTDDKTEVLDVSHIAAISKERAVELANNVLASKRKKGSIKENGITYFYKVVLCDNGNKVVVFLDCTRTLEGISGALRFTAIVGFLCFVFFFLIISLVSKRAVKSIVDNIKAQNEFITNAGHELKTPLAIISANTEVVEMISGKNEWTESTLNQVNRMSGLVSDLIFLARMNERTDMKLEKVNLTKIVTETAMPFKAVLDKQKKTSVFQIADGISVKADEKLLTNLVSILVDNAVKYCDEGGEVCVSLQKRGRGELGGKLVISNSYVNGKNIDYTRFFERFYREDESHNSKKQGYGIGLSMAESIVKNLRGKLSVSYVNDKIFFTLQI